LACGCRDHHFGLLAGYLDEAMVAQQSQGAPEDD
jgi:hypothetical protein